MGLLGIRHSLDSREDDRKGLGGCNCRGDDRKGLHGIVRGCDEPEEELVSEWEGFAELCQ